VDSFTPIINPPQTAILGVGRIANRPVAIDTRVGVRHTVIFSLTFDHRVVDGYTAGEFLGSIVHIVESASELDKALGCISPDK
jgi:pyruvate dehydrogenase E2 component (dihydrolipoamide acetyltransferase)